MSNGDDDVSNVISLADFGHTTYADENPVETLEKAKLWGLKNVVIVGFMENGDFAWGGSTSDMFEVNALADILKQTILNHILPE